MDITKELVGKIVEKDIKYGKTILIPAGDILTRKNVETLKKFNIKDLTLAEPLMDPLEDMNESEVKEDINPDNREYHYLTDNFNNVLHSITLSKNVTRRQLNKMIEEIPFSIERLIKTTVKNINLKDILQKRGGDSYLFEHQLHVSIVALFIGVKLGYNKDKLRSLIKSTLVYDIGMLLVDKEILGKSKPLTKEEKNDIREHVKEGICLLRQESALTYHELIPIYEHHERIDGSGYPRGLKGFQISEFGKIIAVADAYDAMISNKPYRNSYPESEVLEYFMGASGFLYDPKIVKTFIDNIHPYPEGMRVGLSNGVEGIIVNQDGDKRLHPLVLITNPKFTKEKGYYDLSKNKSVKVIRKVSN